MKERLVRKVLDEILERYTLSKDALNMIGGIVPS